MCNAKHVPNAISILGEVSIRLPNLIETFYINDSSLKTSRDISTMPYKAYVDFYLFHLDNTFRRTCFKMKWLMVGSTSSVSF